MVENPSASILEEMSAAMRSKGTSAPTPFEEIGDQWECYVSIDDGAGDRYAMSAGVLASDWSPLRPATRSTAIRANAK